MNINARRATWRKGIFARFEPPAPRRLASQPPRTKQFRQRLLAKGLTAKGWISSLPFRSANRNRRSWRSSTSPPARSSRDP